MGKDLSFSFDFGSFLCLSSGFFLGYSSCFCFGFEFLISCSLRQSLDLGFFLCFRSFLYLNFQLFLRFSYCHGVGFGFGVRFGSDCCNCPGIWWKVNSYA